MCFESSQLAWLSNERLIWMPHVKFAHFWLMRRRAETTRRYHAITRHLGLVPTHSEKHGPRYLLFDLLEQLKEEELPLRPLQGQKSGSKNAPSWNLTRR